MGTREGTVGLLDSGIIATNGNKYLKKLPYEIYFMDIRDHIMIIHNPLYDLYNYIFLQYKGKGIENLIRLKTGMFIICLNH